MKIRSIKIKDFRCIRECEIQLGSGLNVLHGRNDLGKSTVAEAIRAAFTAQTGLVYDDSVRPWQSEAVPKVSIEFEIDDTIWRIEKGFTSKRGGGATLWVSQKGREFRVEQKGRAAEGRLRELLDWGQAQPGGRGRGGSKPTFLMTALLGGQGEADAIFASTLADDPVESGRDLITRSLDVVGQDPLVSQLLEKVAGKLSAVMTLETGRRRSVATSPLVKSTNELNQAEDEVRKLQSERAGSEGTMKQLRAAIEERDLKHEQAEQAKTELDELETRAKQAASRQQAEDQHQVAIQRKNRAQSATDEVAAQQRAISEAVKEVEDAKTRHAAAVAKRKTAENELKQVREALQTARSESEKQAAIADSTRENRLLELEKKIAAAEQRVQAAREVLEAEKKVEQLDSEVSQLSKDVENQQQELGEVELRLETQRLKTERDELESLRKREAEAKLQLDQATREAKDAAERLTSAEEAARQQNAALEELETELDGVASSDEKRAADLQSARAELTRLEGLEDRAGRELQKLNTIAAKTSQLRMLREQFNTEEKQLLAIDAELAENSRQAEQSRAEISNLEKLLSAKELVDVRERAKEIQARREASEELRVEAGAARQRAQEAARALQDRKSISDQELAQYQALARMRSDHLSRKPESASMPLPASFGIAVAIGAVVYAFMHLGYGSTALSGGVAGGASVLAFAMAGWTLRTRRTNQLRHAWSAELDRLDSQWSVSVESALQAASVPDLDGLAEYKEATRQLKNEVDDAEQGLRQLEADLASHPAAEESSGALQREVVQLEAKLAGEDPAALLERSEPVADTVELHRCIASQKQRLHDLGTARQSVFENQVSVRTSLQNHSEQLKAMEHELDGLAADSHRDADEVEESLRSVRAQKSGIHETITALEETTATQSAEARSRLDEQQVLCDKATSEVSARQTAVMEAREKLVRSQAAYGAASKAAETPPGQDLDRDLAELQEQLRDYGWKPGEPLVDSDGLDLEDQRHALQRITQDCSSKQALLREAKERALKLRTDLDAEPSAAMESAQQSLKAYYEEQRTTLEQGAGDTTQSGEIVDEQTLQGMEAGLKQTEEAAKNAVQTTEATDRERQRAEKKLEGLRSALEEKQKIAAEYDLEQSIKSLEHATNSLGQLPVVDSPADVELDAARRRRTTAAAELRAAEKKLSTVQGALNYSGGHVLEERLREQEEIVQRRRARHADLEDEYEGFKRLYDTLSELQSNRASHLGRALAKPITEKFGRMAGGRYVGLRMSPELKAEGIVAAGDVRDLTTLSVGTREQLATLVRLAIAEHLKTALLLDDQFVNSDEERLGWLNEELRRAAAEIQIIVFTCRPSDYLSPEEMTTPAQVDWGNDQVVVADLNAAIRTT